MKLLLFKWTTILPLVACLLLISGFVNTHIIFQIIGGLLLMGSVVAAVHHAEVVAAKVGEPYGTIILALAVTILEVSIIVSLMLTGGKGADTYARDTLFAAVMLILNGILGLSMLIGALKYSEQTFASKSVTFALVSLVSILVFSLVLPNFTTSTFAATYSMPQLIAVAVACLVIYSTFIVTQTIRHRHYFITESTEDKKFVTKKETYFSLILLFICLAAVVLLAKNLSPIIEVGIARANLPTALIGVVISTIILLPEGVAAIRAAQRNQYQTSINLALGSALATIGLSIPAVVVVCIFLDLPLVLGLDKKSMVLLALSIFTVMLSLNKGRTSGLYGIVLLVNLMMYILTIIYA